MSLPALQPRSRLSPLLPPSLLPPSITHRRVPERQVALRTKSSSTDEPSWWPVALVFSAVAGFGSALSLYLHASLRTGMDLAIFDQAVRALSQGEAPVSAMKGGMNLWGDHFHPVILLAAPAYWLRPKAGTLVVVQAIALGLTCATLARSWA